MEVQKEDLENERLKTTLMEIENTYIPTIQGYAAELRAKISDLVTFAQDNIPFYSRECWQKDNIDEN